MGKSFTFIVDHTARADLASKRKLRRRRGACGNCKRRKVACNGAIPCQHCHKASISCQYAESNRSTRNTAPISEVDTTIRQTITPDVSTSSSPQDLENTDFFPDNLTNVLTPDFYCDELAHVSVSDDPMDLFHWNQLGEAFGGPIPGPIPGPSPRCEQLESAGSYEDISSTGLDSDYYSQDDTQYGYSMNDLSRDQTSSTSITVTEESPHRDHVRSSLHSWLLTSMRNFSGEKNNHAIEASQKLLATNSSLTECCSDREMDLMAVLTDVRSERSFNKEFFHKRINAGFAELHEIGMYLNFEAIEELVVQIISNPFVSGPASIALFFSLFAIGSRRLDLSHGNGTIKGATIGYFRIALRMRSCMYGEVSLLKSQAFLLMTYFSFTVGASSTSSLMADATSCLQTLRLHSSSEINKLSSDRLEQTNLKRAFWGIYSMEKPYSLQEGLLPLIHGEYADHNISSLQSSLDVGTDLLGVYVRYAEVCSSILRQLHSQRHESRDCSVCCGRGYCEKSPASTLCRLEDSLMMWKTDFSLNFNVDNLSALSRVERRHRLAYITRFHFATIAIYSLPEIEATDMSKERRCESARQILNLSSHISWSDMCDNWELCSAISLATCIIATGIIQKASLAEAERSIAVTDNISTYNMYSHKTSCEIDIPYIGIAIGFFSRISLSTTHDFGNAAMELCSFALSLARC